jgi:hypothetical protein
MADKDIFAEREHWLEEEYFRKKDRELIERMRERQAREAERQHMGETIGVTDQELIEALQELGYSEETVQLLHIVPLVQVAWAEGGVADKEARMIFQVALSRGIEPGSPAYHQLNHWLSEKPSEQFFESSLHAIRVILETLPPDERKASRRDLITYCSRIASLITGGILGQGQISDEEKMLIAHIAAEIGQGREEVVKQIIRGKDEG